MSADSGLLSPAWADTSVTELLGDEAWVRAMLEVEVALARAQAGLGIIPEPAAGVIAEVAGSARLDLPALVAGVRETGNPVVALVGQLTAAVASADPGAAEYVHRGSTSQDILDSAMMLVAKRAFGRLGVDLERCAKALGGLVERHRDTPMAGRTLTQHAVPVTFGLKAAGWLSLVLDAAERVRGVAAGLPVSLGGAAGTLAAYQEYAVAAGAASGGVELVAPVAAELGLAEPPIPWHALRTPIADLASALTFTGGALGKLAADVAVLTRTEIGELIEPSAPGRGVSSAMPQKHNPVYATLIATAARQLPPTALVLWQAMVVEDERSAGGWHAEWQPLRECLRLALGAAANAAELTEGLVVVPQRMRANLELTGGAVVSERLNVALAPLLGKAEAKRLLAGAAQESARTGAALLDVLSREVSGVDLAALLDPREYTGAAATLVDRVLARYAATGKAAKDSAATNAASRRTPSTI
jgi:3-carboxy-cis,cis-muconate cycloisomerase